MTRSELQNCYFEWMTNKVFRFSDEINNYYKLLCYLNDIEYSYTLDRDINRYNDGLDLKKAFCSEVGVSRSNADYLGHQCSVLEMMVALAIRCEVSIMTDPAFGDRTWVWFMAMLQSMRLDMQTNDSYNETYVEERISIMLNRTYDAYGDGALFIVRNPMLDMRQVEVWIQMNWFLSENF